MADKPKKQPAKNIALVVLFIVFLALALASGLVALFTDNWLTYTVAENRTAVFNASKDSSMLYHTRTRGLFWIVVKDTKAKLVVDRGNDPRFPVEYTHNATCGATVSVGFWSITGLMTASVSLHLAYLIIAGIAAWMAGFALIFGLISLKLAVIVMILGEVSGVIGMVLFHIYIDMEKTRDVPEFATTYYFHWNDFLKENTTMAYSYSFMLQWVSLGIGLLSIILGVVFIKKWGKKGPKQHKYQQQEYPNAHDNHAYEKDYRQTPLDFRPSPKMDRREPARRSWANGPEHQDNTRRRAADDNRYDYRDPSRDDRRDYGPARDDYRHDRDYFRDDRPVPRHHQDQPFYPVNNQRY